MKPFPRSINPLAVRTDFSDDAAWQSICTAISAPQKDDFQANVEYLSDQSYEGLKTTQLRPEDVLSTGHGFLFIVDDVTMELSDHPILVVDSLPSSDRVFRVIPSEMWAVKNNLSLGNLEFRDFVQAAREDGVFRGFPVE